jgi:hypothetical protein
MLGSAGVILLNRLLEAALDVGAELAIDPALELP